MHSLAVRSNPDATGYVLPFRVGTSMRVCDDPDCLGCKMGELIAEFKMQGNAGSEVMDIIAAIMSSAYPEIELEAIEDDTLH